MASIVSGVIEHIQTSGSSGTTYAIASSAYGYCETAAGTAIKNVDMTGFDLKEGVTVHIKFANANDAANPKLKFNNEADTNAKPIVQANGNAAGTSNETDGWYAGAVLSLTYDGTNWVRDQGFNTTNTDEKVKQTLISTSADYKLLFTTSASPTSGAAEETYYSSDLSYNPSTKALVTGGTIDGFILAAAAAKAVTDVTNSTARAITSNGQNLMTERAIYYGLPTINGVHNYNSNTTLFAPTSAGTSGYVLKSQGSGAPIWEEEYKIEILDLTGVT